ncbi:MAG TPA: PEP-CTERM sorting domain-containing protein [Candidatus Omnitrophota bacterium]|nr:PEP-CTERM sorting domain-containing protein [Candidatus Omnitrophota bacterium]
MDFGLVWSFDEIRISNDPDAKVAINPDIYGNTVVWEDQRDISISGGNACINVYDLVSKTESTIFTASNSTYNSYRPQVYGNYVVWRDYRSGSGTSSIYGYDLSTKTEFKISESWYRGDNPSIYGDTVIYNDYQYGSPVISGYNISTKERFQVWGGVLSPNGNSLYGDIMVFENGDGVNCGIFSYDLSTGKEFLISSGTSRKTKPIISGNNVVWEDWRNGNPDIYAYNLATQQEFPISTQTNIIERDYAVYGNIVVYSEWLDDSSQPEDLKIYGYDISSGRKFLLSDNQSDFSEGLADIYGNIVVWQDARTGDHEIYYTDISAAVPEPSTIVLMISGLVGVMRAIKSYQKAIK